MIGQNPRILIVDDEQSIRVVLERTLSKQYQIETAPSGEEALLMLQNKPYDLILLDLHMGEVNGLDVLTAANRIDPDIIVIILTAYGALESAVEALRLGAFDYIFKPVSTERLRRRVAEGIQQRTRALQKRALFAQIAALQDALQALDQPHEVAHHVEDRFLKSGCLTIDRHHRTAVKDGRTLSLTTAELDVLVCLMQASPEPITPQELVQCALGYHVSSREARELIKWHIHRLRKKIEPDPHHPVYLKTIRNRGYLWVGN